MRRCSMQPWIPSSRNFILRALERCDWNVTEPPAISASPLSTLKHKMRKLEIRRDGTPAQDTASGLRRGSPAAGHTITFS